MGHFDPALVREPFGMIKSAGRSVTFNSAAICLNHYGILGAVTSLAAPRERGFQVLLHEHTFEHNSGAAAASIHGDPRPLTALHARGYPCGLPREGQDDPPRPWWLSHRLRKAPRGLRTRPGVHEVSSGPAPVAGRPSRALRPTRHSSVRSPPPPRHV